MENKICDKCGLEKSLTEFYFRTDSRKYRNMCKKCCQGQGKIYTNNHRKQKKEYDTIYYKENIDDILKRNKKYREDNPDLIKRERINYQPIKTKRHLERLETDINYKITNRLRIRLNDVVRNNRKAGSAVKDLGCDVVYLKNYLEVLFCVDPKTNKIMSWENYGEWHIDHIIPLASFDLTDREQFLKACHYTNLQPLWAEDNLKKGSKIIK